MTVPVSVLETDREPELVKEIERLEEGGRVGVDDNVCQFVDDSVTVGVAVAEPDGEGDTVTETVPVHVAVPVTLFEIDDDTVDDTVTLVDTVGDVENVCQLVDDSVTLSVTVADTLVDEVTLAVTDMDGDVSTEGGEFNCPIELPLPSCPLPLSPQHRNPPSLISAHVW